MTTLVTAERLDHVHLCVADRERSVAWYRRVLGLRLVGAPPGEVSDDHPIFLGPAAGGGDHCLSLFIGTPARGGDRNVAFRVDGPAFLHLLDALPVEEVRAQSGGVLTRDDLNDYGMAFTLDFLDLDGNELELVTYDVAALREARAS